MTLSASSMFFMQKVEVLWSKGIKKLPSLFPLLVKGRNLYKLKAYRQVSNWLEIGFLQVVP